MEKQKIKVDIAMTEQSEFEIDELIGILNDWKSKGATHVETSGSDYGAEIYSHYNREETDEELQDREKRATDYAKGKSYVTAIPPIFIGDILPDNRRPNEYMEWLQNLSSPFNKETNNIIYQFPKTEE